MEFIQIVTVINALSTLNEQVSKIINESKRLTPDHKKELLDSIAKSQGLPREL